MFCVVKSFQNNDIAIKTQAQGFHDDSMIYQFNLYIDLNSWRLDREEDRDLPQPHSIFFFPLAAKTNWTLRPFPFSSFFPATAAFRFKGTRQPSTPAHQYNGALHFFKDLSLIFDLPSRSLHYVLKTWLIWLWPMNMSSPKLLILRHESVLILYR